MGKIDEYTSMDATALAELVRNGDIEPAELVESAIGNIEKVNPEINAVITPMYDIARDAAKGALPEGPFKGVPFLIKDLLAEYGGARQGDGTDFTGEFTSPRDTELVARFKRAGLIVVGKTNTPELGILPTTEPRRFGASRNPWDTGRSTGGSSGGSAAAVAARIVPMAHGNDGGGSIRIPAACNGLFGLKPTRGRNPLGPDIGDLIGGLVCEHVLTRSVRDSAAMLDATAGPDTGAPYYAPPPSRPFLDEVGADPGTLKIGFSTEAATGAPVHEDCVKAVKDVAALLEDLGHNVEEVKINVDGDMIVQSFLCVWFSGVASSVKGWAMRLGKEPREGDFEPLTWALKEAGEKFSAVDYLVALAGMQKAARMISQITDRYDVVLTPTLAEPPLELGSFDAPPDNPMLGFMRAATYSPFTPICNMTGQPAMNVPLVWNDDNIPIGVHFMGRYADEKALFRLAAQLEEARPWADRKPPVCV